MEKQKLKELLMPYLPYDLKAFNWYREKELIRYVTVNNIMAFIDNDVESKFILRPLSDLEEYFMAIFESEEEVQTFLSDKFLDDYNLTLETIRVVKPEYLPYGLVKLLYKHHFDIHDLISQGFSIDINNLKK